MYLVALFAIAGVALLRSTRPFLALGLGAGVAAIDLAFGGSLGVVLILSDLVYAAVKYGSDRGLRLALWITLVTAGLLAVGLLVVSPHSPTVPTVAVQLALIIFVSAAWGWAVRSERARTRSALVQAHAQQTGEMRERIAHDLHDLVANQIAVAGLHIEAAKLRLEREGSDPDPSDSAGQGITRATAAAGSAGTLASLERAKQGTDAAHRELRALIEVLMATLDLDTAGRDVLAHAGVSEAMGPMRGGRTGSGAAGLASLGSLLPGGRVLTWPNGACERVQTWLAAEPPATQAAVIRVLRELIANAAKYGAGDAAVSLDAAATGMSLTVMNQIAPGTPSVPGTGLGLRSAAMILGMVGGHLASGRPGDGSPEHGTTWVATITVPLSEQAPATPPAHLERQS